MPRLANSRLAEALGADVVNLTQLEGRGYSNARRSVVQLADGRRVFTKAAVDANTSDWLRAEHGIYTQVDGSFLPRLVAFLDDEPPILVLET